MLARKSLSTALLLVALAAILLAPACSMLKDQTSSKAIRSVADDIALYQLPDGYREVFAVHALGYSLVNMEGPTERCHIYLLQAPKDLEAAVEDLKEQARSLSADEHDPLENGQVVEERPAMIRGQEVTLLVGEGRSSDQTAYREVTALFAGKEGPAMVSISSPLDRWDWELVDAFLASFQ